MRKEQNLHINIEPSPNLSSNWQKPLAGTAGIMQTPVILCIMLINASGIRNQLNQPNKDA